jgi:tetratricopeptide (TPR) repeat protein
MVSYRSIWIATWLAAGIAGIGSAPAATLNFIDEVQKPVPTPNVERRESSDPRNRPRTHELLGTVKSLLGNVLTITLDQDDPLGGAKKGNTIIVEISADTRVRTGDQYLPGTQVFVAASPDGSAWAALDVRERRAAAVADEPEPSPRKPELPPTQETIGTTETGWGSLVGPARSAADAIIAGQGNPGTLNDLMAAQRSLPASIGRPIMCWDMMVSAYSKRLTEHDFAVDRAEQAVECYKGNQAQPRQPASAAQAEATIVDPKAPAAADGTVLEVSRGLRDDGGLLPPPSSRSNNEPLHADASGNAEKARSVMNQAAELEQAGQVAAALAKLDEALRLEPTSADAYYQRGSLRGRQQQYDQAIADFENAILYSPSAPGAYNNVARIHYLRGDKAKAFEMLDRSLTRNATNPHAYMMRGVIFMQMGKVEEGEGDLDYGERLQPGLKKEYAAEIDRARHSPPQQFVSYPELAGKTANDAALLVIMEQDRKAVFILDAVVAKEPNNADAFLERAKARYNLKQFAAAQADVRQAIRLKPEFAEAHRILGRCLQVWGKGDEAIKEYSQAIALEPGSALAYIDRSVATFRYHPNLQRTALNDLDAALKVDPRNPFAWYNRAPYYAPNFGDPEPDWDFMIHHYDKAIEYKPDFAGAYGSRGVAYLGKYLRTKDPALQAQGQNDIKTALELRPDLKATIEVMVDDLQAIPASKAYLKQMMRDLFSPTLYKPRPSTGNAGGGCPMGSGGAANSCKAGDNMAYDRYKSGAATGGDKGKYGDY